MTQLEQARVRYIMAKIRYNGTIVAQNHKLEIYAEYYLAREQLEKLENLLLPPHDEYHR